MMSWIATYPGYRAIEPRAWTSYHASGPPLNFTVMDRGTRGSRLGKRRKRPPFGRLSLWPPAGTTTLRSRHCQLADRELAFDLIGSLMARSCTRRRARRRTPAGAPPLRCGLPPGRLSWPVGAVEELWRRAAALEAAQRPVTGPTPGPRPGPSGRTLGRSGPPPLPSTWSSVVDPGAHRTDVDVHDPPVFGQTTAARTGAASVGQLHEPRGNVGRHRSQMKRVRRPSNSVIDARGTMPALDHHRPVCDAPNCFQDAEQGAGNRRSRRPISGRKLSQAEVG